MDVKKEPVKEPKSKQPKVSDQSKKIKKDKKKKKKKLSKDEKKIINMQQASGKNRKN